MLFPKKTTTICRLLNLNSAIPKPLILYTHNYAKQSLKPFKKLFVCALLIIIGFNNYGQIYVSDNFNNAASFISGVSYPISFYGTTAQEINNSATLTFHDAIIDNSTGVTLLSGNINIDGTLTLTNGIFTTGSNIIDLGSSGSIVETAIAPTSYVTGKVKATRDIGNSTDQTFGGIGLEINETTASANSTVVTRTTGVSCTNGTNLGIKRYYDITPITNTELNATIKFYYFDHELNVWNAGFPINEDNMIFYKSIDSPDYLFWTGQLQTNKDIGNN